MKELVYEAPQVEMIEVNVENGFAVSGVRLRNGYLDEDDEIY